MSLAQTWTTLRARYDGVALQPPRRADSTHRQKQQGPARSPPDAQAWQTLMQWCRRSAAPGGASRWQGRAAGDWSVATLVGPQHSATRAWAETFALTLDGSLALEAMGSRWRGLAWRAQVKLHDAMWWRSPGADHPWDAGWASTAPPSLRQLQHHFLPRRATLILADAADAADAGGLHLALASLAQRSDELPFALRWLWVGDPAPHCSADAGGLRVELK